MIGPVDGSKKLIAQAAIGDHGTSGIHQQEHFDSVFPGPVPNQL